MNKPDYVIQTLLKIRELNDNKLNVGFSRLITELPEIPRVKVHCALDVLSDWGLIEGGYNEVSKGRFGYCYKITETACYWLDNYGKQRENKKRKNR
jgi:hypothetical protein